MLAGSGGCSHSTYTERQEVKPESRSKKHRDGGWLEGYTHSFKGGLISDSEIIPAICARPRSMTSANISDGNKRSDWNPVGMNAIIMYLLDGQRPQLRGSATTNDLVPSSCSSRVVGDSERDLLQSELIHPVIGEVAITQHTITH